MPKEMLPLVDKPLIQYGVEEVVNSGISEICIVTGRGKAAIEDHFDVSFELEHLLHARHKEDLLQTVKAVADRIEISYVRQKEALGLGHAVLTARSQVGSAPFVVVLSDDVIEADVPCTRQLLNVFYQLGAPVLALMEVSDAAVSSYGIVEAQPVPGLGDSRLLRVTDLVEKPNLRAAPSRFAVIGRYVLTPDIFPVLAELSPGHGAEIQLTDALRTLAHTGEVYGLLFEGKRFDAGDKLGFLIANVEYALRRPEMREPLLRELRLLLSEARQ